MNAFMNTNPRFTTNYQDYPPSLVSYASFVGTYPSNLTSSTFPGPGFIWGTSTRRCNGQCGPMSC